MLSANPGPAVCRTIAEIASIANLSDKGRRIIQQTPQQGVASLPKTLVDQQCAADALRLMPQLLPLRPAVWWGCLCAWHAAGSRAPQGVEELALGAAVHWVYHPTMDKAKAMGRAWRAAGLRTPGGCCARAAELAGWLEPEDNIFRVNNATAAAKILYGAVQFSLMQAKQRGIGCSEEQLVQFGMDVAENKTPWT